MHKSLVAEDQLQVEVFRVLGGFLLESFQPDREILSIPVESCGAPLVAGEFLPIAESFPQVPRGVAVFPDSEK